MPVLAYSTECANARVLMEDKLYRDGLKIRLQLQRGYIKAKSREREKKKEENRERCFCTITGSSSYGKKGKSKKESSRSPLDEEGHIRGALILFYSCIYQYNTLYI